VIVYPDGRRERLGNPEAVRKAEYSEGPLGKRRFLFVGTSEEQRRAEPDRP